MASAGVTFGWIEWQAMTSSVRRHGSSSKYLNDVLLKILVSTCIAKMHEVHKGIRRALRQVWDGGPTFDLGCDRDSSVNFEYEQRTKVLASTSMVSIRIICPRLDGQQALQLQEDVGEEWWMEGQHSLS